MKHLLEIQEHYIRLNNGMDNTSVANTVERIVDRMTEMDMPEQEIISILLPMDHRLNYNIGLQEPDEVRST